jgi:hypothetical protein
LKSRAGGPVEELPNRRHLNVEGRPAAHRREDDSMRSLKYFLASLAVAGLVGIGAFRAAADKPLDIETIMEKAHKAPEKGKPSLFKTVVEGKANKDQKEELLKLYTDLSKNKPPKGDEGEWKKRCDAILGAAKDVVADKPGSLMALKKAVSCMDCHEAHKGE